MSSNDNEPISPAGNPTDHNDPDHVAGATNPEDQLLLEALQQFIVPHVGATAGQTGSNQNLRGPEAMNLVKALKEFILSVVRGSESKAKTTIEVHLDENVHESETAQDVDNADDGQELEVSTLPDIFSISHDVFNDYNAFHECVLRQLREHVFNRMPIRLLCFVLQGSHLQIFLADKEDIYAHLIPVMEDHIDDSDYRPEERWSHPGIETNDEAATRLIEKHIKYAILSHTWLHASPGEVTYADWTRGLFNRHSPGYHKLVNFCKVAWKNHGLTLGWMDTVSINKDSSSELDESIRSMHNWYAGAKVCIIYLADTRTMSNVHLDTWFTRGWTLQELLAPNYIKFYSQDWTCLTQDTFSNDKEDLGSEEIRVQILKATTITADELRDILMTPLSRRMQLAASRQVTREEDTAYSLMGIFNVSISTAYGEGAKRAFRRLLCEILNSTSEGVMDIFNWAGTNALPRQTISESQLLPSSPENYVDRSSDIFLDTLSPLAPLTITHLGLHIPVLLMPTVLIRDQDFCYNPIGHYSAHLTVSMHAPWESGFITTILLLLDAKAFDADKSHGVDIWHQVAVFNIQQGSQGIWIPQTCIGKLLGCFENPGQVTSLGRKYTCYTEDPLVFALIHGSPNNPDNIDMYDIDIDIYNDDEIDEYNHNIYEPGFWIPEHELARHGMQFISLYL